MKYIKLFQTIADKQAAELDYPNTNYVVENSKASIEREAPIDQEHVVAKYNITNTSNRTRILFRTNNITYMIVDGVQQPSVTTGYTFSTTGEHTVKYKIESNWTSDYAFQGCSGLTNITIPDSVTSIGNFAFYGCSNLTSAIGSGVTSIGISAFFGCSGLTNVTIPDSVTSIGESAFYGCSGLTSITIPDSVTSIGQGVFSNCRSLTSVTIPDSVISIGYSSFESCTSLTSVTIPDSVTSIGGAAFYACSGLTSVTIPDSVTSIGDGAFDGCSGLTSVTVEATTPPTVDFNTFTIDADYPIYVPAASVDTYKAADIWSAIYASRIQAIQ